MSPLIRYYLLKMLLAILIVMATTVTLSFILRPTQKVDASKSPFSLRSSDQLLQQSLAEFILVK